MKKIEILDEVANLLEQFVSEAKMLADAMNEYQQRCVRLIPDLREWSASLKKLVREDSRPATEIAGGPAEPQPVVEQTETEAGSDTTGLEFALSVDEEEKTKGEEDGGALEVVEIDEFGL